MGDIIVGIIFILIFSFAVVQSVKQAKKGGCAGCSSSSKCCKSCDK